MSALSSRKIRHLLGIRGGTFTANGTTPVTVPVPSLLASDTVVFGLNTVGGTVGAHPTIQTITPGTGFTVACTASDTSIYNYTVLKDTA